MSVYSIRDLERITNTRAHTIRIWEQRYGLLEPERTETNIRFYNDGHVKKLLNVCTLLGRGYKISRISQLSSTQIQDEIDGIMAEPLQPDGAVEAWVNRAIAAVSTYDATAFNQLFAEAVEQLGLEATYERILYPLLVRTGLMWIKDTLLPAQEHFLSNIIRQKLFAAIDTLPTSQNSDQQWLLFLHEGEEHEIGLLFAFYNVLKAGKNAVYLGSRVPYGDLKAVANEIKPTHLYTFFVSNQPENFGQTLLEKLTHDFPGCKICFSGAVHSAPANCYPIQSIHQLTEILSTHAAHTRS